MVKFLGTLVKEKYSFKFNVHKYNLSASFCIIEMINYSKN